MTTGPRPKLFGWFCTHETGGYGPWTSPDFARCTASSRKPLSEVGAKRSAKQHEKTTGHHTRVYPVNQHRRKRVDE